LDDTFADLPAEQKRDLVRDMLLKKNGDLDMDWSEMVAQYGLAVSADTLRKSAVGLKLAEDAGVINLNSGAVLVDNQYAERVKMRDLISQLNAYQRNEARSDALRETIHDAVKKLTPLPRPEPVQRSATDCELVLGLGDLHYGAEYTVKGLYGDALNIVRPEIIQSRLNLILGETIRLAEQHRVKRIHLCCVGDLIDGMLRQSQLMRLRLGVVDSTIELAEILAVGINYLAGIETHVHFVSGNHSEIRPLGSNKGDFEDENLERIIWWYLKIRLANNPDVIFDGDCDKLHCVEIAGFKFMLLHGDNPKDVTTLAKDAVNLYGSPIDYFICGHLHKQQEYLGGMTADGNSVVIRVPSVCGADPYANRKYYGGKPGAVVMIMKPNYGRYCVYPLTINPLTNFFGG